MAWRSAGQRFADWYFENVFEPIFVVLFSLVGAGMVVGLVTAAVLGLLAVLS